MLLPLTTEIAQSSGFSDPPIYLSNETHPSSISKGQNFTITGTFTYDGGNTDYDSYYIDECLLDNQFTSGRPESVEAVTFVSASATKPGGGSASLVGGSGSYSPSSEVRVGVGQSTTVSFTFKADSAQMKQNDEFLLYVNCWFNTDLNIPWAEDTSRMVISVAPADPEPTPEPEPEPTPDPEPTPQPEPEPTPDPIEEAEEEQQDSGETEAPIASATIPEEFQKEGSQTTDISSLTAEEAKNVKNFTLHNKNIGKVVFTQGVNLSGDSLAEKFNDLDEYVTMKKGVVTIDTEKLGGLKNRSAKVTMNGLNLVDGQFVILHDGKDGSEDGSVSDVTYKNGNLSFKVKGFSTYKVSPNLEVEETEVTNEKNYTIKGTVGDLKSTISVNLNGEKVDVKQKDLIDKEGNFEVEVELEEGDNEITVSAKGVSGVSNKQVLTVEYDPDADVGDEGEEDEGMSLVTILGISAGGLLVVAAVIGGVLFAKKRKGKKAKKVSKPVEVKKAPEKSTKPIETNNSPEQVI